MCDVLRVSKTRITMPAVGGVHLKTFKTKAKMKNEYDEVGVFIDGLLSDDWDIRQELKALKIENLKLIAQLADKDKRLNCRCLPSNGHLYCGDCNQCMDCCECTCED